VQNATVQLLDPTGANLTSATLPIDADEQFVEGGIRTVFFGLGDVTGFDLGFYDSRLDGTHPTNGVTYTPFVEVAVANFQPVLGAGAACIETIANGRFDQCGLGLYCNNDVGGVNTGICQAAPQGQLASVTWLNAPTPQQCEAPTFPGQGGVYQFAGTSYEFLETLIIQGPDLGGVDLPFDTLQGPGSFQFNFTLCYPNAPVGNGGLAGAVANYRMVDVNGVETNTISDTLRDASGQ
jgi:hypothetical protein